MVYSDKRTPRDIFLDHQLASSATATGVATEQVSSVYIWGMTLLYIARAQGCNSCTLTRLYLNHP